MNQKYETEYQILIHSEKKNNKIIYEVSMYFSEKKYFISKISINNLKYEKLFSSILSNIIDKWKEINLIQTSLKNFLDCKIKINNINELRYVRSLLKSNFLIQDLTLKSINLNNNLYSISFVGTIDNFKKSLEVNRLNLFYNDKFCNIELR